MAECPNGHANAEDQKFCGECGEPISQKAPEPTEGQSAPDPAAPAESAPSTDGVGPNAVPWFRQPTALVLGGLALIVVVAIVVALSSGGGSGNTQSSGSNSSSDTSSTDTPTSVDTTPVTAAGLSQPVGTWTVKGTYSGGYTATTTLQLGAPARSGGSELTGGCSFDPQTDGVVAGRLQIVNTTTNFSISPTVKLTPSFNHHRGELTLVGDYRTSSGPNCDKPSFPGDALFGVSWQSVAPGQTVTTDFYLILRNYFSPNTPNGDSAGYHATFLAPGPGQDVGGPIEGPGVVVNNPNSTLMTTEFPISGSS